VTPRDRFLAAMGAAWDALAEMMVPAQQPPPIRWATAKDNPLRSSRAFLDAARRGDFPTGKRGREIAARWTDVEAWIEGRKDSRAAKKRGPPRSDPPQEDVLATLERAGYLRPKRPPRQVKR